MDSLQGVAAAKAGGQPDPVPAASLAAPTGQTYSLFPALDGVLSAGAGGQAAAAGGAGIGSAPLAVAPAAGPADATLAPAALAALITQVAQAHGLPPSLLTALVRQESGFDPHARSSAGAMGLTQLMPGTAASLGVADPWDPSENLNAGAAYLAGLLQRYGGNVSLALAAYNAGPGAVSRWGGVPPYPETQAYVRNVEAMAGLGAPVQTGAGPPGA